MLGPLHKVFRLSNWVQVLKFTVNIQKSDFHRIFLSIFLNFVDDEDDDEDEDDDDQERDQMLLKPEIENKDISALIDNLIDRNTKELPVDFSMLNKDCGNGQVFQTAKSNNEIVEDHFGQSDEIPEDHEEPNSLCKLFYICFSFSIFQFFLVTID